MNPSTDPQPSDTPARRRTRALLESDNGWHHERPTILQRIRELEDQRAAVDRELYGLYLRREGGEVGEA